MPDSSAKRYCVLFSGRVQGVGFRYTTQTIAGRFAVKGYVRNLSDGRVELIAEGSAAELDAFLSEIQQQMEGYIRDTTIDRQPGTGEFSDFGVRF